MNASDFKPGDQVIYMPGIAYGNPTHPACERGVVSSTNGVNVFVRYWVKYGNETKLSATAQATSPDDLVLL